MRSHTFEINPPQSRNSLAVKFDSEQQSVHFVIYFDNPSTHAMECRTVSITLDDVETLKNVLEMYMNEW